MPDKKISQLPVGDFIESSIFPFVTNGVTSQNTFQNLVTALEPFFSGGGGSQGFITVTKSEMDDLIADNELIIGSIYEITGVQPSLYDDGQNQGTTIYLQALDTNKVSKSGYGKFYNPQYQTFTDGYGIYQKYSKAVLSNIVGSFYDGEPLNGNNGQNVQFVYGNYTPYAMITGTSDGSPLTSVTGQYSLATADITVTTQDHSQFSKKIWGGYSWTNLDGENGSVFDKYYLSANWSKDPYTGGSYNLTYDYIEYDYDNDFITRRYDAVAGNDVYASPNMSENAIKGFQFGNASVANYAGVYYNSVDPSSFVETINFAGGRFAENKFIWSQVYNNDFLSGSYFYNNTLDYGDVTLNLFNNAAVGYNKLGGKLWQNIMYSTIAQNPVNITMNFTENNSTINGNILTTPNASIDQNKLGNSASINQITIISGYSRVDYNVLDYQSSITNVSLDSSFITLNILKNSTLNFNGDLISKDMRYNEFNQVNTYLEPSATLLYNQQIKTVYRRPDGAYKIRYYDNSDQLVIANITA